MRAKTFFRENISPCQCQCVHSLCDLTTTMQHKQRTTTSRDIYGYDRETKEPCWLCWRQLVICWFLMQISVLSSAVFSPPQDTVHSWMVRFVNQSLFIGMIVIIDFLSGNCLCSLSLSAHKIWAWIHKLWPTINGFFCECTRRSHLLRSTKNPLNGGDSKKSWKCQRQLLFV